MRIAYISENKMFLYDNGSVRELPSERVAHYAETVRTINQNKEWKHTGTGAQFTGTWQNFSDREAENYVINGLAWDGRGLIYSMRLGGLGGIYRKDPDKPEAAEEHIFTGMNEKIGRISCRGNRLAAELNGHIAVYDLDGGYSELTDGDSVESFIDWAENENILLCSSKGIARTENGEAAELSPGAVLALNLTSNSLVELYSDEKYDCISPRKDSCGNLYFIKQPYQAQIKRTPLWKDILLFPVRIIKAIGGFLNAFSVIFGGEPLREGKNKGNVKSKQRSDKDIFFEGRLIEAEKNERENAAKGDKNPGIFPVSRVLVKIAPNGEETVIKRGVQDYLLTDSGEIICSNGREIIRIGGGGEEVLAKAKLAHSLCKIPEVKNEN